MMTIPSPTSAAVPTSRVCNDLRIDPPRPPAPMSVAITTMLSAMLIVWFTPDEDRRTRQSGAGP